MKWDVKSSTGNFSLTREQLLDLLMTKVVGATKPEFTAIVTSFNDFLQDRQTMSTCNIDQLITMGFSIGYYYRVFLEKNDVEILGEKLDGNMVKSDSCSPSD
jgi:hypothetical protein